MCYVANIMCFTPDGNAPSMCRSDSLKFFRSISLNSYRNGTHLNSGLNTPYGVETEKKLTARTKLLVPKQKRTHHVFDFPPGLRFNTI